jgi:hypothetical protein
MRTVSLACALCLLLPLGCDDDGGTAGLDLTVPVSHDLSTAPADRRELPDEGTSSSPDLAPACVAQTLLDGMSTLAAQGWAVVGTASAVTSDGVVVEVKTKGVAASPGTSAQALVTKNIGIASGTAYALEWRLKVIASDGHNANDAPVALMASFTPPFGMNAERAAMIYFDAAAIGWADNAQSFAVDTSSFHVYRLDVSAAGHAELRVDGALALARDGFTTTGTIAVGDQTNDQNVDSQFEIYQVRTLCP